MIGGTSARRGTLSKRLTTQVQALSLRQWAAAVAVLAIGVSGLFGGLEKAEPPAAAVTTALNTPVDGGAWRVTIKRAQLHQELPPMVLSDKTNRWIVIVANVEITAERTWTVPTTILTLSAVDGLENKTPQVLLMRDASKISRLHPAMPEDVAFFWEQRGDAPVPKEIIVQVQGRTYRQSSLDGPKGAYQWLPDTKPRATVPVPLQDKRNPA